MADTDSSPSKAPLPPELCRFRTFASKYANGTDEEAVYDLLRGRLRFKNIETFNDPFEGRPQYVAAYNDPARQREALVRYLASIAPDNGRRSSRRRWAEGLIRGKSLQEIIEAIDKRRGNIGKHPDVLVLCLSAPEAAKGPLTWSYYADSHRGVCIHFATLHRPLSFAFPVEYSAEYPRILVPRTAQSDWDGVHNTLLRKCDLWSHEHEHRVIRVGLPVKKLTSDIWGEWDCDVAIASPQVAKAITFGCRMEISVRTRLIEWIQENAPHIELWQAKLHDSRYEVERDRIQF